MSIAGTETILERAVKECREKRIKDLGLDMTVEEFDAMVRREQHRKTHPKIHVAVISSAFFGLLFLFLHIGAIIIVSFIFSILSKIPILSFIVYEPIRIGSDPGLFVNITAAWFASFPVMFLMDKTHKHRPTFQLSCKLVGIYTIVFWIIIFIINLISKQFVWQNLVMSTMGFVVIDAAKDG